MGEVVSRCGVRSPIKIIVRESMCQGVMSVQLSMSCRCRVRESSVYPSVCFYEDALQLKRGRLCVSMRGSSSSMKGMIRAFYIIIFASYRTSLYCYFHQSFIIHAIFEDFWDFPTTPPPRYLIFGI
jgi:hypothetical protein